MIEMQLLNVLKCVLKYILGIVKISFGFVVDYISEDWYKMKKFVLSSNLRKFIGGLAASAPKLRKGLCREQKASVASRWAAVVLGPNIL